MQGEEMAHVRVKELEPGMVLNADVCDQNGRFLVGSGCELTGKHIKALQSWGVVAVEVEGEGVSENVSIEDISPELRQELEELTRDRFKYTNVEHPFMAALMQEAINFQLRNKLQEEQTK